MKHKIFPDLGEIRRRAGISCYHQLYQLLDAALNDGTIPAGGATRSVSCVGAAVAAMRA